MKKLLTKDKKVRTSVNQTELKRFVLKQIANNSNFINLTRWKAVNKLIKLKRVSSKTQILNRCVKTFNKKTFHKFSNISRMEFYKLVNFGGISGMKKSSW